MTEHPHDPDKLSFFDIPVFVQKVKEFHRNYPENYSSEACGTALYNMNKLLAYASIGSIYTTKFSELNLFTMQREHYALICNEPFVDDLQAQVEAIFN